tara:strand:+ start:143 stop:637 length:495 start_codon:yes stop_codon:yes gene_type:complete
MNTGIIGASAEKIIRSDFFGDKAGNAQGFAVSSSDNFVQAATDGSGTLSVTRLGNLSNQFITIGGQLCQIVRFSSFLVDTQLSIVCNDSDLSQTDISSVTTTLGTANQSDVLSFGHIGDASAGTRIARWTWRIGTNGYTNIVPLTTSTESSAGNYRRSYLRINL